MNRDIRKALKTEPWVNLYELNAPTEKTLCSSPQPKPDVPEPDLLPTAKKLAYDICIEPDSQYGERIHRLEVSARKLEKAKNELLTKEFAKELQFGQSLFLVPTTKLFEVLGLESPYRRDVSNVHSFSVLLLKKLLVPDPLTQSVKEEAFIGDSNSTGDLLVQTKNGERHLYEVTLSVSNVCANAAKAQNKGFSQIIFVCRDYDLKQAVWAKIRNAGFNEDFLATIRCVIFSQLIRRRKQFISRNTR